MRVVEPQQRTHESSDAKKGSVRWPIFFLVLISISVAVFYVLRPVAKSTAPTDDLSLQETASLDQSDTKAEQAETLERTGELRMFSGNEFRLFYDNLLQSDLNPIGVPPSISGNDIADARIRQIAEQRGYRLRANPSIALPSVQGYQLHESAHEPWLELQSVARSAGHEISIVSAYRSVEDQRQLFTSRLIAEGVDIEDVANGIADEEINTVLITSSIPGYSKHHTGYTFDLLCAGFEFENFVNSTCNEWMVTNNYEQPKKYGFIPSYPPDADLQGPDPEAWEYVYVGADLLRQ